MIKSTDLDNMMVRPEDLTTRRSKDQPAPEVEPERPGGASDPEPEAQPTPPPSDGEEDA